MQYKVLSSGSKGNCVVIGDECAVMVDIGLSFSKIKDELYNVKYLIITHTHGDHLKLKTYTLIKKLFPRIQIIGNFEVAQVVNVDYIANEGFEIKTKDYTFFPFRCPHDVLCYGYTWEYNGKKIIYATDTSSLELAPRDKYDFLFLESNHDEKKLEEIRDKQGVGYDAFQGGKRHLSTQECKNFYYSNRRGADSELIELHKSKRFY